MRLNVQSLQEEKELWKAAGYRLPQFDHKAMVQASQIIRP